MSRDYFCNLYAIIITKTFYCNKSIYYIFLQVVLGNEFIKWKYVYAVILYKSPNKVEHIFRAIM